MYPAQMIRKACKNLEKFYYELNKGEATVESINKHSMKLPDRAPADVDDYDNMTTFTRRRSAGKQMNCLEAVQ